jgi:hypothetical protein
MLKGKSRPLLDRDVGGSWLSLEVDVSSLFGLSYRCRGLSVLQATLCSCSSLLVVQFLVALTCEASADVVSEPYYGLGLALMMFFD